MNIVHIGNCSSSQRAMGLCVWVEAYAETLLHNLLKEGKFYTKTKEESPSASFNWVQISSSL